MYVGSSSSNENGITLVPQPDKLLQENKTTGHYSS